MIIFSRKDKSENMITRKNKLAQDKKSKIFSLYSKRAQEEMVGFALIIIIVAVILLIFVGFAITRPEGERVESYEVESFVQSMLQYTSDCSDNLGKLSIQDLIFDCRSNLKCLDNRNTCEVLDETLNEIMAESWKIGNTPVMGYDLNISVENNNVLDIFEGNKTNNFKGSTQLLPREVRVVLNVYY